MSGGISDRSLGFIIGTLQQFNEIEKAAVFGSRALGNYKSGSDIDMVIYGETLTDKLVIRISAILNEELPIPYEVDLLHYESISNENLRRHIDDYAITIYEKPKL